MAADATAPAPDLNLKQVARALGVHYRTAYRYVRLGDLPARRDAGGWRVAAGDLEAFAHPLDEARRAPSVDRLADLLAAGDEVVAWSVLRQALGSGTDLASLQLDVVLPALDAATDRAAGPVGAARRAVAARTALRLVLRLGGTAARPGRARGVAVVVGPLGDGRPLHAAVAANLLRQRGFRVVEAGEPDEAALGALAAELADELGAGAPAMVVRVPADPSAADRVLRELAGASPLA